MSEANSRKTLEQMLPQMISSAVNSIINSRDRSDSTVDQTYHILSITKTFCANVITNVLVNVFEFEVQGRLSEIMCQEIESMVAHQILLIDKKKEEGMEHSNGESIYMDQDGHETVNS